MTDFSPRAMTYGENYGHSSAHRDEDGIVDPCPHCKKDGFTTVDSLKNHVRNKHVNEPLQCPVCEYKTSRQSDMTKHIARHKKSDEAVDKSKSKNDKTKKSQTKVVHTKENQNKEDQAKEDETKEDQAKVDMADADTTASQVLGTEGGPVKENHVEGVIKMYFEKSPFGILEIPEPGGEGQSSVVFSEDTLVLPPGVTGFDMRALLPAETSVMAECEEISHPFVRFVALRVWPLRSAVSIIGPAPFTAKELISMYSSSMKRPCKGKRDQEVIDNPPNKRKKSDYDPARDRAPMTLGVFEGHHKVIWSKDEREKLFEGMKVNWDRVNYANSLYSVDQDGRSLTVC